MKAIQITEAFHLQTVDIPAPECGDGQILLRVRYAGFCGSDLNTWRGGNAMAKMPVIPGHEIGAQIAAVGKDVPAGFTPGMTVTLNPYTNCGRCASCRNRRPNACEHNETLGVQRDGAMCEYIALPWEKVIPAEGIDVRDCALIEPMSVGFHAVNRAAVNDSDTVMVIGCGMIGVGAIVRAHLRGATVIAVDLDDEKLALARSLGADYGINSATQDVSAKVAEITGGLMADVIIEAVGAPVTQNIASASASFTGRVVLIGYSKSDTSFQTRLFVQKELDIRGSRNALPEDFRAVIRWMQTHTCPSSELITATVKPEGAANAMRNWHEAPQKVFRVVVEF